MSIKGWTDDNYEAAKARHALLSASLLKRYAESDWRWIRDTKCEVESLGEDILRFEAKLRRQVKK